ncbi:hypothetical protein ACTMU2_42095 [Cupriavidus basilensis]
MLDAYIELKMEEVTRFRMTTHPIEIRNVLLAVSELLPKAMTTGCGRATNAPAGAALAVPFLLMARMGLSAQPQPLMFMNAFPPVGRLAKLLHQSRVRFPIVVAATVLAACAWSQLAQAQSSDVYVCAGPNGVPEYRNGSAGKGCKRLNLPDVGIRCQAGAHGGAGKGSDSGHHRFSARGQCHAEEP